MEPLKKKIKHDEPPFVSPVLKSVDWYNGEAGQKDQSESDAVSKPSEAVPEIFKHHPSV